MGSSRRSGRETTLMDWIREKLAQDPKLNAAYQRELTKMKRANQVRAQGDLR